MKKIKLKKGLAFNKEAISKLNDDQLSLVKGGGALGLGGASSKGDSCSCCHHSCNSKIADVGNA
ncbi:class I lanthipeptide [Aquimarina sp. 2201CG1-2-11]|uniref:class I lanthipeptide n=1 Tax=Aquimarina discodermiae TaxID=3231043 RepID=UPI003461DEBD